MRRIAVVIRAVGLAALLCSSLISLSAVSATGVAAKSADNSVSLTINGAQRYQTIDGFGVNANSLAFDNGTLTPALEQLTDTFGATVWRVIVESKEGWQDTPDTGSATGYDWSYYEKLYETPKFQDLWGVLSYLQQKQVPTIMLNVMGCAPVWMGGCTINPSKEDYYVKMETSLLYYARNVKHLRIDVFGPMNEEDKGNPEGPSVGVDQYVRILNKLATRMNSLGLGNIKLLGPDTAITDEALADYIPALMADPTLMTKIAAFGIHDYSGDASDTGEATRLVAPANRNVWVTEYSAWCDGCDNGAPNPNNWSFAADTADYLLNYIQAGAASALVYDGYDSYYEHHGSFGYWGLLAYDATTQTYTPRKRFYTVAQIVQFARPGMVRIGATSSNKSLRAIAFTDPKTGALTIVGSNSSSTAATVHGTLTHLAHAGTLALYQTTQTLNMVRGTVSVNGDSFTAQIAANSVYTITSLPFAGVTATATPAPTPKPTPGAQSATLGNTAVGASLDDGDTNYINGSRFTTDANAGAVTSMSVHVGGISPAPNNQYELAIYTDNNGSPGSLVAHSAVGTLAANAWNAAAIHATLEPNTAYWLMYNTNGAGAAANDMNYDASAGVPQTYSAKATTFGTWPASFGSAVMGLGAFSIYATYAKSASTQSVRATGSTPGTGPNWLPLILILIAALVAAGAVALVIVRRQPPVQPS